MLYEPYGKHNICKKSQVQLSEVKSSPTFKIYLRIELFRTGAMARHDNIMLSTHTFISETSLC